MWQMDRWMDRQGESYRPPKFVCSGYNKYHLESLGFNSLVYHLLHAGKMCFKVSNVGHPGWKMNTKPSEQWTIICTMLSSHSSTSSMARPGWPPIYTMSNLRGHLKAYLPQYEQESLGRGHQFLLPLNILIKNFTKLNEISTVTISLTNS